ncbi:MAG TPA: hypothetical protein VGR34_06670 [Candidatus Dormibacteraeota bacterium]|nr:hypothetical protein [Candidatus Dormibacteraeota bacterium]
MSRQARTRLLDAALAVALLVLGLAFRATFIQQGFNPTDEGWLLSAGRRIVSGQVLYRDFDIALPPFSLYKVAALLALFGDGYTVLAARWAFAVEATLGSVLAYLIMRRFAGPGTSFLVTIPTVFFSILLYYFDNYTYDGEILLLGTVAVLVHSRPGARAPVALAGILAGLAILAKPTFLLFVPVVLLLRPATWLLTGAPPSPLEAVLSGGWRWFLAGCALGLAPAFIYFGLAGAEQRFLYDAVVLPARAHPVTLDYFIWQDMPRLFNVLHDAVFAGVLLLIFRAAAQSATAVRVVGLCLAVALPVLLVIFVLRVRASAMLLLILGLLLVLVVAAAAAARWRQYVPASLPLLAAALQYMAQLGYSGVSFSYLGAYLTVPVAGLFLVRLGPGRSPPTARERTLVLVPAVLLAAFLVWVSVDVVNRSVYRDATRGQLTASFATPKLAGVLSTPAQVEQIDAVVAVIDQYSNPGDPIFVMPDFPILYYLTGRTNPTRQDWYFPWTITESDSRQAVLDLERHPPRLALLQVYDAAEIDPARRAPIDYQANTLWKPMYDYLTANYTFVGERAGLFLYVPRG